MGSSRPLLAVTSCSSSSSRLGSKQSVNTIWELLGTNFSTGSSKPATRPFKIEEKEESLRFEVSCLGRNKRHPARCRKGQERGSKAALPLRPGGWKANMRD